MYTAVATSLTPSDSVASTDAMARSPLGARSRYGAERVPRIGAASQAELDPIGRFGAGHVRERAFSDVHLAGTGAVAGNAVDRCRDGL
jgi:hypothetical protein